ncbi:hypothetical protein C4D60_Mb10t20150 [Musa balbisiana]|uniref:PSI-K n=1 Tax=Musa balbisiana TaxID=52838 RepID=A0A4S8IYH7_MUSBA|nr:hypothetical protein C4D60_Mb10t20150 [Musa balbisiana]
MVTSTSFMLFAGRFGLASSANRKATAGLRLEVHDSGLQTGDPDGFTLADTLACGVVGHIIGVGVVLGLKNLGAIRGRRHDTQHSMHTHAFASSHGRCCTLNVTLD